jgi:protein-S-isoprenylcysteine O-methyltransferase
MTQALRLWFLVLFGLGLLGTMVAFVRFRADRKDIEKKVGPLPTPGPVIVSIIGALIVLTGIGEITDDTSIGWASLRVLGVGLSLYTMVMLPWAVRTLGRFGVPGIGVFRDHALVTSGPFRVVRNPGYSGILALWLGAGLGTLNWLLLTLWPLLVIVLFMVTREEEGLLRAKFGTTYDAYAAKTGRFIPKPSGRDKPPTGPQDNEAPTG